MESARLKFKLFEEADFHLFYKLAGDDRVMARIKGKGLSKKAAEKRFAEYLVANRSNPAIGFYSVTEKETDEFVGLGKIETKEDGYEIGYALLEKFWGKGYGSETSLQLVNHAKSIPSIKSVFAIVDPKNTPSKKILIKCGFVFETDKIYEGQPAQKYRLVF